MGFTFDATTFSGPTFPLSAASPVCTITSSVKGSWDPLRMRLLLASHLARYLRDLLEHQKGYTASVGVSTSKLLSKLAGNVHKPSNQTTLLPPYVATRADEESNITRFLDSHDIGKIPGIGYKLAQKLRTHILRHNSGSGPHGTPISATDKVTVRDVRLIPGIGPLLLEKLLGGPGSPRDIGTKIWGLINGVDYSEVHTARAIPTQISIEDSYRTLESFDAVRKELVSLAASLIRRMRIDLTEEDKEDDVQANESKSDSIKRTRWLAHPRTLRLSTRTRSPPNLDGTHGHSFNRVSRSSAVPQFVFNMEDNVDSLAERLVQESILSMFRKLHPEKGGWHLSLLNIAVTNMVETAGERKQSSGRDIEKMFRRQETSLPDWKVTVKNIGPSGRDFQDVTASTLQWENDQTSDPRHESLQAHSAEGSPRETPFIGDVAGGAWEDSDSEDTTWSDPCKFCGALIPHFASAAHELYHTVPE